MAIPSKSQILSKLTTRFGPGEDPRRRGFLYHRICTLIEEHGDPAYKVLCEVAAEAAGKEHPAKYFTFSIVRRMSERGFTVEF